MCWLVTPGKIHHCEKFSAFMDNGSHCGALESQPLKNGLVIIYILMDNNCVSHLFRTQCVQCQTDFI